MTKPHPTQQPPLRPNSPKGRNTRIRCLVVDDSAFMRKAIREMLESDPALEVVDVARNGEEGLEKIKSLKPDVVTLDIEMPKMDGREVLRRVARECRDARPAIIVCSSITSEGSHEALKALRLGAADIIAKDASAYHRNLDEMRETLLTKVHAVAGKPRVLFKPSAVVSTAPQEEAEQTLADPINLATRHCTLTLIASSTGGPPVLERILAQIPAGIRTPVVIAQHMPVMFTKAMAQRLDHLSPLSVVHAENGMPLHPGVAYVIPGGNHGRVRGLGGKHLRIEVSPEPVEAPFKPSATELFNSAANIVGGACLAAVLTGLGEDGKPGAEALVKAGSTVLAQDPGSCVVYGMPKAANKVGGVHMTPDNIAKTISSLARRTASAA